MENVWRPSAARLLEAGGIEFTFARALRSPNRTMWKHWRIRHQEKQFWRGVVLSTLVDLFGVVALRRRLPARSILQAAKGAEPGRARVEIDRWMTSAADTIRDVDNLVFSTKFLLDALVAVGLLRDDSPAWADRPIPTQQVSADGRDYTVVRVIPLEREADRVG